MKRDDFFLKDGKYVCGVCGEIPVEQLMAVQGNLKAKRSFHRATDSHKDLRQSRPERSDKGIKRRDPIKERSDKGNKRRDPIT